MNIRKIHTTLFSLILVVAFFRMDAQCPKQALYYRGLFYPLLYNGASGFSIPSKGYKSCNGILPKNMDSLALSDRYSFDGIKDSILICSWPYTLFYDGSKWGIFSSGKPISGFSYDYVFTYRPDNWKYWEHKDQDQYILVRIGKNWGLLNGMGTPLTTVEYQLPQVNPVGITRDSICFTKAPPVLLQDSANRCVDCKSLCKTYPLASPFIVLTKNSKLGAIDSAGKTVVTFIYDSLFYSVGCIQATREGKRFYLTQTGREITGFDAVLPVILRNSSGASGNRFFSGIFLVRKNGKWGLINSASGIRTRAQFDLDSGGENADVYGEVYTDLFIWNKKYYSLEIRKDSISIRDSEEHEVSGSFIEK
jgi:hypothetical protein